MYKYNKDKLDYERVKIVEIFKIVSIIIIISITVGFSIAPRPTVNNLSQEEKLIVLRENNQFSEAKLIKKIKELNFRFPHIVLAQSYQESGHFKSTIFLENSNMFGMKEAFQRTNLAHGSNRGHAYYETWQDSVLDYALYYATYLSSIKTEEEYYDYLKQNYAGDTKYIERLKQIIKTNKLKSKF